MYSIKETYFTIQGEGFHTGRSAVFVRFAGCNLWSGHEKDRAKALCKFCDTDFVGIDGPGGGKFATASKLADHILSKWPKGTNTEPFVVCTGGEPLLQIDSELVEALHDNKFEIAIETNGTIKPPQGIDWICVSPKAESDILINKGDELKLVYPQEGADPSKYEHLEFDYFSLQPMDSDQLEENTKKTIEYCNQHPLGDLPSNT
jgi:Organic radical activating enzymes